MITENKIYNPAAQSKQWLIENFVVRTKVFEKIFKDIQTGKMKYPEQHYLIQGQRGMGKTTLLLRLKYEIENTPLLNSWLVPVFFNEESYDLTTLSNLWEKLLKYLDDLWQTGGKYYNKTDEFVGKSDYEEKCFDYLQQVLKEQKKKLVIFFDNFGQLFLDNLKDKEQHRLREILMDCADIRFIGASAIVLKDLHDYSKPFFEFFKIINLEGLSKTETFDLIKKLTELSGANIDLEKNRPKIETLAILTGGVIRTIMLVYEAILADQDGTALRDLEMILDRITPLYKHRIEDLPVQQRRIVDVIAKNWDAISAKDIASNIREDGKHLATKVISAQLQQLEKNNVIEKKQTTTKNHFYQLKERFLNIWYLMRLGDRQDKCRVIWLTKFLEMWYEDEVGLGLFVSEHIKHLRSGKYHSASAILITEALSHSNKLGIESFETLVKETSSILNEDQKKYLPDLDSKKLKAIPSLFKNHQYSQIIEIINSIEKKNSILGPILVYSLIQNKEYEKAAELIETIKPERQDEYFLIGVSYFQLQQYQKSIDNLENYKGKNIGGGFFFLGKSYLALGNKEKALLYFDKAISEGDLRAYTEKTYILFSLSRKEEAEKSALQGIQMGVLELKPFIVIIYLLSGIDEDRAKAKNILDLELNNNENDSDFNYLMGTYFYFENGGKYRSLEFLLKAHENYLKDKKTSSTFYYDLNLDLLLDILIENKDKHKIRELLSNIKVKAGGNVPLRKSFFCIWNSDYKVAMEILIKWLQFDKHKNEHSNELFKNNLLLLMSKKQFHLVYSLFDNTSFQLKEIFKPIYYALMHYLKDEYPNEIIKMGEELKQPVDDIMKRVEEMAIEYK